LNERTRHAGLASDQGTSGERDGPDVSGHLAQAFKAIERSKVCVLLDLMPGKNLSTGGLIKPFEESSADLIKIKRC
jgi:hypothetical protein